MQIEKDIIYIYNITERSILKAARTTLIRSYMWRRKKNGKTSVRNLSASDVHSGIRLSITTCYNCTHAHVSCHGLLPSTPCHLIGPSLIYRPPSKIKPNSIETGAGYKRMRVCAPSFFSLPSSKRYFYYPILALFITKFEMILCSLTLIKLLSMTKPLSVSSLTFGAV